MSSPEMQYLENMARTHSKFFAMVELELANIRAMLEVLLEGEKERLVKKGISTEEAHLLIQQKVEESFQRIVQNLAST
ncbi:MAG TPA: hypothetical protein VF596_16260 [Pyrinomonadaceae bacterium]|jgi:hypothetical protein